MCFQKFSKLYFGLRSYYLLLLVGLGILFSCSLFVTKNENGHELKKLYFDNGNLYFQGYCDKDGKYQGECWFYYSNGKDSMFSNYKDNQMHGPFKVFHTNGKIKELGNHDNGKRVGDYLIYSKEGILTKHQLFDKGSIVSQKLYFKGQCVKESFFDVSRGVVNSEVCYKENGSIDRNRSKFLQLKMVEPDKLEIKVQVPEAYTRVEIGICQGAATTIPFKVFSFPKNSAYSIPLTKEDYYKEELNLTVKVFADVDEEYEQLNFETFVQLSARELPHPFNLDAIYH